MGGIGGCNLSFPFVSKKCTFAKTDNMRVKNVRAALRGLNAAHKNLRFLTASERREPTGEELRAAGAFQHLLWLADGLHLVERVGVLNGYWGSACREAIRGMRVDLLMGRL